MTIRVRKVSEGLYTAQLLVPYMPAMKDNWSSIEPIAEKQIVEELENRGAHRKDIVDTLYEADRN
jgi:hypothetical protein